jgi:hypothetical protein
MPKIKKLTIFLLIFTAFSFSFLFLTKNRAWAGLSREEWNQIVGDNDSNFTLEDKEKHEITTGLPNSLLDMSVGSPEVEGDDGALQIVGRYLASMVAKPPISSTEYLADLGENLGIVKPAYAQGVGWQALRPLLKIWKAFRNMAYLGFVIIFIVIGFMIMFRVKLGQETAITLQAALPKIIITLLVITFSYAIAGLMIDLIYISLYLIVGFFKLADLITEPTMLVNKFLSQNLFQFFYMERLWLPKAEGSTIAGPAKAIEQIVTSILGDDLIDQVLGFQVSNMFVLVLVAALLFALFKLFFALLICYVSIVVKVVLAPINLLFNAIPGNDSLVKWLKGLLADIAPFPVTAVMFLLAALFIGTSDTGDCNKATNPYCVAEGVGFMSQADDPQSIWAPPFLYLGPAAGDGTGSTGGTSPFLGLIGMGIIMLTPKMVSQVKKVLQVEPSGFGGAIMGGLMAGPKALGAAGQAGIQTATIAAQLGWRPPGPGGEPPPALKTVPEESKGKLPSPPGAA